MASISRSEGEKAHMQVVVYTEHTHAATELVATIYQKNFTWGKAAMFTP